MEIVLRPAQPADLPSLLEIEKACFNDPWGSDDLKEFNCLVALIQNAVAGFLIWREIFAGDEKALPEIEILNAAVKKECRRRGVARALLGHLLERRAIYFLEVRKSNAAARQLYGHLGFVEVGQRAKYYRHPTETAIVMKMKRC